MEGGRSGAKSPGTVGWVWVFVIDSAVHGKSNKFP